MKKIETIETIDAIEPIDNTPKYYATIPIQGINGRIEKGQEVKDGDLHITLANALYLGVIEVK